MESSGYLNNACMDIVTGAFDYNTVLRRVVTQLTNSGLRQIEYSSGYANRIEVAARRAVMTGLTQLSGKIAEYNAEKLGTEYLEVEWHAGARPTHTIWQGRVWSQQQLYDVCGLGTVTGLCGANCYHTYFPFVPGVSVRTYTDDWLDEQNRKESEPTEFRGKEYTLYEAKQRQRQMETAMRAQREKVQLLQKGGADPDDVMLAKCKYQGQLDEYARFSNKMGLKQERERIYLDMKGRVAPGKISRKMVIKASSTDNLFEKSKLSKVMGIGKDKILEYNYHWQK
nr:phage minor capsid protein [[Ruminococcus] lactaris]